MAKGKKGSGAKPPGFRDVADNGSDLLTRRKRGRGCEERGDKEMGLYVELFYRSLVSPFKRRAV